MAFSFSLEECARINADLSKAANSKDEGRLKDILQQLKASNPTGKLTVRSCAACSDMARLMPAAPQQCSADAAATHCGTLATHWTVAAG